MAVVGPAELEFGSEHVDVDDVERAPIDGPVLMWVGLGLVGGGPVVGELDGGEAPVSGVWSVHVVVDAVVLDEDLGFEERVELPAVEELIS